MIKINRKCVDCNKQIKYGVRCYSCSNKKKNIIHGKYTRQNYCIECSRKIKNPYAKRCIKCCNVLGNNGNWKDGKTKDIKCKICGELHDRRGKKCVHCSNKGRENSAWNGWASKQHYGIGFNSVLKRKIRIRDNNICQLCSKRKYGEKLAVHHIDYNKKNCKEENLISLHRRCNTAVNGDRDYWFAYLNYIIGS